MNPISGWKYGLLASLPLFLIAAIIVVFPGPPTSLNTAVYGALDSVQSNTSRARVSAIYGPDFFGTGEYVEFPQGRTRYWLVGPGDGPRVSQIVLIHGLSVPALIYKNLVPILEQRGYRMLIYDLYGRGWSDAPQADYNAVLYTTQVALLMQHVRWETAHLVGVSMGAAIAVSFAECFPRLVQNKLVLIAPTGLLEADDIPRTVKLMSSPLVQRLTSTYLFRSYVRYLANKQAPDGDMREIVRIQSAHLRGYNAALASSLRLGPIRGLANSYARLGSNTTSESPQMLVIHGTADQTVPYSHAERITTSLVPQAQLVKVEGGPHDLVVSHAEIAASAIATFLGKI